MGNKKNKEALSRVIGLLKLLKKEGEIKLKSKDLKELIKLAKRYDTR